MITLRISTSRVLVFCLAGFISACSQGNAAMTSEKQAQSEPSAQPTSVVGTSTGRVEGLAEGAVNVFKGIPYAAPPVGDLRWKAPQPAAPWDGVKKVTKFGPACFQPTPRLSSIYEAKPVPMSEDCLTLNIWAPKDARNAPVFFWIYGGALWSGSNRDSLYDGARMAKRGVIVVAINYRLGPLGWLALPQLSAESPNGVSGNYGLQDQIAALNWVKTNIHAFGGDPANVTIAGESAGGLSVMYLLASPQARGLFAKAIAQSAYMISMPELKQASHGMPSTETSGTQLMKALNAPDLAALRAMDPAKLTDAAAANFFTPWVTVDGHFVPKQLVTTFDKGEQAHVPLLAGFNSGELRSLRILVPPTPASEDDYVKIIRSRYGELADQFLHLYPASNMPESILATTRDAMYGWTAEKMVRSETAADQPAYLYFFDHGYPAADAAGLHGFHASELPFVFGSFDGTPPKWPAIPDTPEQHKLSDAMLGYWTSFASTGKPVAEGEPNWPAFGSEQSYMAFTDAPHPSRDLLPGAYQLTNEVVCRRLSSGDQPWGWNVGVAAPPQLPPASDCAK